VSEDGEVEVIDDGDEGGAGTGRSCCHFV
jgi:hypothetical protein